jgi:hypothetical protein
MPKGWTTSSSDGESRHTRNVIIISVSVLLTCIIVCVISVSVLWRRRRKQRKADVERIKLRKVTKKQDLENDTLDVERTRPTQKLWFRGSARLRASVRNQVRKRRARRVASAAKEVDSEQISPASSFQDRNSLDSRSSRRSSVNSSRASIPSYNLPATSVVQNTSLSLSSIDGSGSRPGHRLSKPPAYRNADRPSRTSSDSASGHIGENPFVPDSEEGTPPDHRWDMVHVATDDKRHLAEISRMRSAPPEDVGSSNSLAANVPVWRDDYLVGFSEDAPSSPPPPLSSSTSSPFPAPPEKQRLAAPMFPDYPSSSEQDSSVTASLRSVLSEFSHDGLPSAPPFEHSLDEAALAPSAPPLSDPEGLPARASAPLWPSDEQESSFDVESVISGASASEHFSHRPEHDAVGDVSLPVYRP